MVTQVAAYKRPRPSCEKRDSQANGGSVRLTLDLIRNGGSSLLQVWDVDEQLPAGELSDFFFVDVDTPNIVAHLRKTGARNQSDLAGADDGNFHTDVQESREMKETEM